jgi:hypothetical protein
MAYSSTYSSPTSSSTSTSTATNTSTGNETSSSSLAVEMTVQSTTSDGSDGLSAALGGEATALGEDTLTVGSVSAEMEDGDAVTTLDGTATMVAASKDPDGGALALTDTFADVSDSAEFVFVVNVETSNSEQNEDGSTATSTSTIGVTAYNLEPTAAGSSIDTTAEPVSDDEVPEASDSLEDVSSSSSDADWDIEGNIAVVEVDASATGDDTFVSVDAFALAIEDELSLSAAVVELGTG